MGDEAACEKCSGRGWYPEGDPSGETEEHWGVTCPVLLERYCDCERGQRMQERRG